MLTTEHETESENTAMRRSAELRAPLLEWLAVCVSAYTIVVVVLVRADWIPVQITRRGLGLILGLGYALIGVIVAATVLRQARSRSFQAENERAQA
jgi:hypothetical protein